jgi:molybdate transport system substrate-binding protein
VTRTRGALAAAVLVAALTGCGPAGGSPAGGGSADGASSLTVFAAASLKGAFTTLAGRFEAAHPGTRVRLSFAGSADLVSQLQQGAPADVLASADSATMGAAVADGLVRGAPVNFASNTLALVVPPQNPAGITSFADLAEPGVQVVVCAPAVPCGAATRKIEAATGTDLTPVSEETAVTDVLNKVQTGEADAGLVYVTDARAAGDRVRDVPFPEARAAVNHYPVATLTGARDAEQAQQFVDLVTGPEGQRVLADAGFGKP